MRGHARPVIGYMGYRVKDRLDLALIDFLAASRPDWSFVFVGPKVGEEPLEELLETRPNIRVVGPVDYTKLSGITMVLVLIGGAVTLLTVTADIVNPIRLQ